MPRIGPSGTWETPSSTAIYWVDTQTTVGGVATFSPTSDDGVALFKSMLTIQFTAEVNTGLATSVGLCGLKAISANKATVTCNVVVGTTILGLGVASMVMAPDGTIVHCFILGE